MRGKTLPLCALALLAAGGPADAVDQSKLLDRLTSAVEDHAVGYESVGQAKIKHVGKKSVEKFDVDVEKGYCYRFFAAGAKDSFKLFIKVARGKDLVGETAAPYPVAFVDAPSDRIEQDEVGRDPLPESPARTPQQ